MLFRVFRHRVFSSLSSSSSSASSAVCVPLLQSSRFCFTTTTTTTTTTSTTKNHMSADTKQEEVLPPRPKKVDHVVKFGNVPGEVRADAADAVAGGLIDPPLERNDDLFWLRDDDRKNEEVIAHLKGENDYFAFKTSSSKALSDQIYKEHISHLKETDDSCPYTHGKWKYFHKTFEGKNFVAYARMAADAATAGAEGAEQVLLDVNDLAGDKTQCDVSTVEPDPKHHAVIAYSLDLLGDEQYTIQFFRAPVSKTATEAEKATVDAYTKGLNIEGKVIKGTTGEIVWSPDGTAIFYCTRDETKRSDKVWCHRLSDPADASKDALLFHEPDQLFSVGVGVTLDGEHVIIETASIETTEVHYASVREISAPAEGGTTVCTKDNFKCFRKREHGLRYSVDSYGPDHFVVLTNADGCISQKLVYVSASNLADWSRVLVPYDAAKTYEYFVVTKKAIALYGRADFLTQIWICSIPASWGGASKQEHQQEEQQQLTVSLMPQPEPIYEVRLLASHMRNFDTSKIRINYSSMTTPQQWIDVSLDGNNDNNNNNNNNNARREVVKQKEVPGGFDKSNYVTERRWATAPDGIRIPMSVLRHKNTPTDKPAPLHLYGYGSYGLTVDPSFSIGPLPLVDRGVIYVIAHVRGGGDGGRAWYETHGKFLTKRNTFQDFVSCAEALVASKVTTPQQMSTEGRSAGGLLMGTVLNWRPDLFAAAIAGVPFVDVMVTMCDASIPLTTGEWAEWGNPNLYKYYSAMLSYSPMENIMPQRYPSVLCTAGLHDPRVAYWEPAKWIARLREAQTDKSREIVFRCDLDAGHFSANARYKYWEVKAVEQAFLVKHLLKS